MTRLLNGLLINFFVFHRILMKLGEVVVHMGTTLLQHHQVSSKSDEKQKTFILVRFSVQNFKVSVELWKSYIVQMVRLPQFALFLDFSPLWIRSYVIEIPVFPVFFNQPVIIFKWKMIRKTRTSHHTHCTDCSDITCEILHQLTFE